MIPSQLSHNYAGSRLPHFPLELVLLVVEFVGSSARDVYNDDHMPDLVTRRCLSSCASTCRMLLPRLQPLLYRNLTLRSEADVRDLFALLDATTSKLATYVEKLYLLEPDRHYAFSHIALYLLSSKRLPNLKHIAQLGSGSFIPGNLPWAALLRKFPSVTILSLDYYRFKNFKALVRIVTAFPRLQELRCFRILWDVDPELSPVELAAASTCLRTVVVRRCSDWKPFLSFFLAGHRHRSSLQADEDGPLLDEEQPAITQLVELLSSQSTDSVSLEKISGKYIGYSGYRVLISFAGTIVLKLFSPETDSERMRQEWHTFLLWCNMRRMETDKQRQGQKHARSLSLHQEWSRRLSVFDIDEESWPNMTDNEREAYNFILLPQPPSTSIHTDVAKATLAMFNINNLPFCRSSSTRVLHSRFTFFFLAPHFHNRRPGGSPLRSIDFHNYTRYSFDSVLRKRSSSSDQHSLVLLPTQLPHLRCLQVFMHLFEGRRHLVRFEAYFRRFFSAQQKSIELVFMDHEGVALDDAYVSLPSCLRSNPC